ncbi:MAG TPA: glycosyltransferase 87 family protein [Pseudonocardiaceae bacterium]
MERVRYWYRSPALLVGAWIVSIIVLSAWSAHLFHTAPDAFVDLNVYRLGVQGWWHGIDVYGQLPKAAGFNLPYVYPPISVLVLGPLGAVSWAHAVVATITVSQALMGIALYLTFLRIWPGAGKRGALLATAVLLPASLLLEPVTGNLAFGQVNTALMALVVIDCLAVRLPFPRGILIGIAAAIKLTPLVLLLYFLVRKEYRSAIWMAATAAALSVAGFIVSWTGSLHYWFGSSGGARAISASAYFTNQTIDGMLTRWALPHPVQSALWLLLSLVLVGFAAVGIRRATRMGDTALAVVIAGALGLMISPTSWSYHWVYVAPALVVLAGQAWRHRTTLAGLTWSVATALVAVTFWAAPFTTLPNSDGRELHWTFWQWFPGNAYTLLGAALLVVFGAPEVRPALRALRRKALLHWATQRERAGIAGR